MGMFYISVFIFFCIHTSRPALSTRVHHKTTQKSFEINHLTAKKYNFTEIITCTNIRNLYRKPAKHVSGYRKNKGHKIIFLSFYQMQKKLINP